jgi:hypothetical protein
LVRDQYVMQIADVCRHEPEQLRAQLRDPNRRRAVDVRDGGRDRERGVLGAPPVERPKIRTGAEIEALRLMVQRPGEMTAELGPWLFTEGPVRRAFEVLDAAGSLHDALDDADPVVADLLTRLSVEESSAEVDVVVVRLVDSAATAVVARMENEARQADDPLEFVPALQWLKLNLDRLRGDQPAMDAAHQLLAWLGEHAAELPC